MAQKHHISYAQAKGAPAGVVIPGLIVAAESLARKTLSVLASAATNHELNASTGLARIIAVGQAVFVRFQEGADKDDTKATGTLTVSAITPGSHAESVVTASSIVDGNTLTIGARTYRFKDTIAQIDDIAIGAGDAAALDNLKHIINGTGTPGTDYFTGSTANADVVATDNTDTTQKIVARVPGTAANALATTSSGATLVWEDTTLGGGTGNSTPGVAAPTVTLDDQTYSFVDVLSETNGAAAIPNQVLYGGSVAAALDNLKLAVNGDPTEGTEYSTGTAQPAGLVATTNTNTTQVFEANETGTAGNAIVTTETMAGGAFGAGTLQGGNSMAFDAYIPAGSTLDVAIEEDQTDLSFIGDGGTATVHVIEF